MSPESVPLDLSVVELRQYTLRPGRRDALIELFDREFVESQDAVGAVVLGQFRDLDDPDRFVWLRGFTDMTVRARALGEFYGGPVWAAHRDAANATMVDSDNVLLLRPYGAALRPRHPRRPEPGTATLPSSVVTATIHHVDDPARARGRTAEDLGQLVTETAENTFPALPVRRGETVHVSLAAHDSADQADRHRDAVRGPGIEVLRLAPTTRSWLR